jgi:hypothetical protein
MTISASEAIALLQTNPGAYTTPDALKALVAQLDIAATGNVTALYSGDIASNIKASDE